MDELDTVARLCKFIFLANRSRNCKFWIYGVNLSLPIF